MKTNITFCVALVASLIILSFQGFSQAPTSGLQIHLPFNGGAADASGNGRNGVLVGGALLTTDRYGNANQAYAFNGTNASIDVNNWNILTGNSPRTMMVWFKTILPTGNSIQYFLAWGTLVNSGSSVMGAYTYNSPKYLGFMGYNNDLWVADQFQFYDNQWHLMAVTFDGSNVLIYLDGVFVTSKATTLNTSSSKLTIGNRLGADFFNGSLDEVRVYNRALTASEIQQTYTSEAPTTSTSTVLRSGADVLLSLAGTANTLVGLRAGAYSTGSNNTFLGSGGVGINTAGSFNTFVGSAAGNKNTTGASNSFLGMFAGLNNSLGSNNTFVGRSSGEANTTGANNTFTGHAAGLKSTTSNDNVFSGYYAGSENTTGFQNTYLGSLAGQFNVQGNNNTFLGYATGLKNTASENTFIGRGAGAYSTTGNKNTLIGTFAGLGVEATPNTGVENTFVGWASGNVNTSGGHNAAFGTQAGGLNTTGSYNTSLGKLAGYFNVTGSLNTYVGAGADGFGTNKGNLSNATAIGANAKVSINDAIVLGDTANTNLKVGIGTTRPAKRLEVRTINANESGIRTTNLTASSPTIAGNGKVLTVNTLGDFILVPDGGSGTNTHSDSVWVRTASNTNYTGGNVGIGVPVPQFKLDVAGPVNIRGINGNHVLKLGSVNFFRGDKNFNGAFGFDAEVDSNYYHSTAIGYKAYASASNVLVLGGVSKNAVNVGIGNSAPTSRLEITSDKIGESGTKFTNLTNNWSPTVSSNKFLGVDETGNVKLYNLTSDNVLVKLKSVNDWSDNVFAKGSKLMSLPEIESYINKNNHLPNIPSASEMVEKGIPVEQMLSKLLKNQEEMTLHLIEMKKEIELLKKENLELKKRNK